MRECLENVQENLKVLKSDGKRWEGEWGVLGCERSTDSGSSRLSTGLGWFLVSTFQNASMLWSPELQLLRALLSPQGQAWTAR